MRSKSFTVLEIYLFLLLTDDVTIEFWLGRVTDWGGIMSAEARTNSIDLPLGTGQNLWVYGAGQWENIASK